jgi:hypothetical protein
MSRDLPGPVRCTRRPPSWWSAKLPPSCTLHLRAADPVSGITHPQRARVDCDSKFPGVGTSPGDLDLHGPSAACLDLTAPTRLNTLALGPVRSYR